MIRRLLLSYFEYPPPNKKWKYEKQPSPPNFGANTLIPNWHLNLSVWLRRSRCERIIREIQNTNELIPGKITMVVLSCKRFTELQRLITSMKSFFSGVENYSLFEKILVDNGSEPELVKYAKESKFFDQIIAHPKNLGIARALNDIYSKVDSEFIMLVEDDFILDYAKPFLQNCVSIMNEFPEIGIIRLKNSNNWWKPVRRISNLRNSHNGTKFWTWLPSRDKTTNVWCCGSTLFRKVSFLHTGLLPVGEGRNQAVLAEDVYGKHYNRTWLAAKIENCYPFLQPNDNAESPGYKDKLLA